MKYCIKCYREISFSFCQVMVARLTHLKCEEVENLGL